MLCLADRLYPAPQLWRQAAATGAHLLWRAKVGAKLERTQSLPDGSWLAHWSPSKRSERKIHGAILVRVIEYRAKTQGAQPEAPHPYRLLTTMLDPG